MQPPKGPKAGAPNPQPSPPPPPAVRRDSFPFPRRQIPVPSGYAYAGRFKANGGVECGNTATRPVKTIRVTCESGNVVINTAVVREGAAATSFTVARRLGPGQSAEIPLDRHRRPTGFRFGTSGGGTFRVYLH